jgi:hypothetical protein
VFFSQVTTTLDKAWKCYQEADPTSEVISDIIDTDGGVIIIPEANEIRGLYAMGNYIVVVASNGVWAIGGVQGYFKATAYTIDKLTDLGCVGSNSIVYANGSLMYWSDSGIMLVSSGGSSVTGLDVSDITNKVLNKYYTSIPLVHKRRARGVHDPLNNIVRFLFSTELSDANTYDMELCYNFNLQAWYKNKYSVGANKVLSPLFVIDAATTSVVEDIYLTDGTLVEDAYIERTVPIQSTPSVKYLVSDGTEVYFCRQMSQEYKDFGNSFYSYIVTGANIFNDTQRQKMIDYITVSLRRTEDGYTVNEEGGLELAKPSSCLMSVRWDFTDTSVANKWTSPYQVYRYTRAIVPSSLSADNGYSLVQTKNKVRGQGKAISIKFESEEGKEVQKLRLLHFLCCWCFAKKQNWYPHLQLYLLFLQRRNS